MEKESPPDRDISARRVPLFYSILTLRLHVNRDIAASRLLRLLARGTRLTELRFLPCEHLTPELYRLGELSLA